MTSDIARVNNTKKHYKITKDTSPPWEFRITGGCIPNPQWSFTSSGNIFIHTQHVHQVGVENNVKFNVKVFVMQNWC